MTDSEPPDWSEAFPGRLDRSPRPGALGVPAGPSRWSRHRLADAEQLRLSAEQRTRGSAAALADACAVTEPRGATAALMGVLWRRPATGVLELAARSHLPVGVVRVLAPALIDAGLIELGAPTPRKVVVVAPHRTAERDLILDLTGGEPCEYATGHPTPGQNRQPLTRTVSAAVERPDWPTPLCLVGSPRGVDDDHLWEDTLRDAALAVVLVGLGAEQSVFNALSRCARRGQGPLAFMVVLYNRDSLADPWDVARARRWLREIEVSTAGDPPVYGWFCGASSPLGGLVAHQARRSRLGEPE